MRTIKIEELKYYITPFLFLAVAIFFAINTLNMLFIPILSNIKKQKQISLYYSTILNNSHHTSYLKNELSKLLTQYTEIYDYLIGDFAEAQDIPQKVQVIYSIAKKQLGDKIIFNETVFNKPEAALDNNNVLIKISADYNSFVQFCNLLEHFRHSVKIVGFAIDSDNKNFLSCSILISFY